MKRAMVLTAVIALSVAAAWAQGSPDTVRFGFFSDIHFGKTVYEGTGEPLYPVEWIRKALSGSLRRNAEFLMLGGDLIESSNSADQYAQFDNEMVTPLPWYAMPGNHDVGSTSTSATIAGINTWNQRGYGRGPNNREYYGFTVRNIAAIYVLNTQAYISSDPLVLARADAQLAECDSFFTANAAIPQKIICSHVPLFILAQNEDSAYFNIAPSYRTRILALMAKHNIRTYLSGHRHENAVRTDGNITVYSNTSLSFQLGTGNVRGYYIYTATANSIQRDFYPLANEPVANKWKWIAYGDTRTNDAAHRSVLQTMKTHTPDYRFILNVGDVTEDGRNASLWSTWQAACQQVLGGLGQTNYPPKYMAVLGNHEMYPDPTAITNWNTNLPGQQQFGNGGRYFFFDHENARFVLLHTFEPFSGKQRALLDSAIRTNTKQWLFVIWHSPIFSYGDKAYEDSLDRIWGAPLGAANCDVIFVGHAHYYVRGRKVKLTGEKYPLLNDSCGTAHIVTGNGGAPLRNTVDNYDSNGYMVAYRYDANQAMYYGYTELDMDGDTMILRHIRAGDGVVMDSVVYHANPKNLAVTLHRTVIGQGAIRLTPPDSVVNSGASIVAYADPALGWKFDGWSGDVIGSENPDTVLMDGDKSITATFSQIVGQYEVRTVISGDGSVTKNPSGPYYDLGAQVTLTATPGGGQKFVGWSGDTTSSAASIVLTVTGHRQVTATFATIPTYKVKVRGSGLGTVDLSPPGGTYTEGTHVAVTATGTGGWAFYEWTGSLSGHSSTDTLVMDGEKEVRALYRQTGKSVYELGATEDTYVRGGLVYSSKNFNADGYLLVQEGSSTMYQSRGYVKFDVASVQGTVQAAWLKLHVKAGGLPTGATRAHAYVQSTDTWSETGLTWTTAPALGTLLDSTTAIIQEDRDYAFDVTSHVATEVSGDKVVSVGVKDATVGNKAVQFDRREGTQGPVLVVATDQAVGVSEEPLRPVEYRLYQNFPNPFNPSTEIAFEIPKRARVRLSVYDALGRECATLVDGEEDAGRYRVTWDATAHASGVYFVRLQSDLGSRTLRMTFVR